MRSFLSIATIGAGITLAAACTLDEGDEGDEGTDVGTEPVDETSSELYGDDYRDGSYGGGSTSLRAVSYINPDIGAATANPDVAANSSCSTPDRTDSQRLSSPITRGRVD